MPTLTSRGAAAAAAAGTAFLGLTGTAFADAPYSPSISVACSSAALTVARGATASVDLHCDTSDGSAISRYELAQRPIRAADFALDTRTGRLTYTATTSTGTDTFSFRAYSGTAVSSTTTGTVQVENTAPVCDPVAGRSVAHDRMLVLTVPCTDADSDALTVRVGANAPEHGTVTASGRQVTYVPRAGFVGHDDFSIAAGDGAASSVERTVSVDVTNAAPTCSPLVVSAAHDRAVALAPVCSDRDGDRLVLHPVAAPQRGRLTTSGRTWSYLPARGFVGDDTLTYTASDGIASSAAARVTVHVTDKAPVCSLSAKTVAHDRATRFGAACTDADHDVVTPRVVAKAAHGTVKAVAGGFTYTPARHYVGKDSFSYVGSDGVLSSKPARVAVTVVERAPRCADVRKPLAVRGSLAWAVSCTDADGEALRVRVVSAPRHGKLTVSGAHLRYVAASGYRGADRLTLAVVDGLGKSDTQVVALRVLPTRPVLAAGKVTAKAVVVTVSCQGSERDCVGTARLVVGKAKGQTVTVSGRFHVRHDRTSGLTLRLSAQQRAVVAGWKAGSRLPVVASVTGNDASGAKSTWQQSLVLPKTAR